MRIIKEEIAYWYPVAYLESTGADLNVNFVVAEMNRFANKYGLGGDFNMDDSGTNLLFQKMIPTTLVTRLFREAQSTTTSSATFLMNGYKLTLMFKAQNPYNGMYNRGSIR